VSKRPRPRPAKTANNLKRAVLTAIRGAGLRTWTAEDLMAATQCSDRDLLIRCCADIGLPLLLPLTPEEVVAFKAGQERQRREGREIDRALAIRDGLRERRTDHDKDNKGKVKRLTRQQRIAKAIVDHEWPDGVPDEVPTSNVEEKISAGWKAACDKHFVDWKTVHPPKWHAVARLIGRRR
jgi:hypothetical protein